MGIVARVKSTVKGILDLVSGRVRARISARSRSRAASDSCRPSGPRGGAVLRRLPRGSMDPKPQRIRKAFNIITFSLPFSNFSNVVGVVVVQDPEGKWQLPGGMRNKGESTKQTAERESKEETGNLAGLTGTIFSIGVTRSRDTEVFGGQQLDRSEYKDHADGTNWAHLQYCFERRKGGKYCTDPKKPKAEHVRIGFAYVLGNEVRVVTSSGKPYPDASIDSRAVLRSGTLECLQMAGFASFAR